MNSQNNNSSGLFVSPSLKTLANGQLIVLYQCIIIACPFDLEHFYLPIRPILKSCELINQWLGNHICPIKPLQHIHKIVSKCCCCFCPMRWFWLQFISTIPKMHTTDCISFVMIHLVQRVFHSHIHTNVAIYRRTMEWKRKAPFPSTI